MLILQVLNYRADDEEPDEEDILAWWRRNKHKFPNLSRLARYHSNALHCSCLTCYFQEVLLCASH